MPEPKPEGSVGRVGRGAADAEEDPAIGFKFANNPGSVAVNVLDVAAEAEAHEAIEALGANTWLSCAERPGFACCSAS